MRKNLLIITFDQARGDWYHPNNDFIELPALSLLASRGFRFERCYTKSPQCVPARFSWLTGKMPSHLGVTKNMACNAKGTIPSIFRKLQNSGWYLKIIGKTHWTAHLKGSDLRDNSVLMQKLGFSEVREVVDHSTSINQLRTNGSMASRKLSRPIHQGYERKIREREDGQRMETETDMFT